jgi:cation transport protein ChaC
MLTGAYQARWVTARAGGLTLRALTFVANRQHRRYLPELGDEKVVELISNGAGKLGTCRAYFDSMADTLEQLGIRDRGIERIKAALIRPSKMAPEAGSV